MQEVHSHRKLTKIVATISNLHGDGDFLRSLYEKGVDVFRINTAHQTLESAAREIRIIRQVSKKIAVILDTKGPNLRVQGVYGNPHVLPGDRVYVIHSQYTAGKTLGTGFGVNHESFLQKVEVGQDFSLDDVSLVMRVVKIVPQKYLECKAETQGTILDKKTINAPLANKDLPTLTAKDKKFIQLAIEQQVDFIAHSFVRGPQDVLTIQALLDAHKSPIRIIAKIENQLGIDNIDAILEVSYGIMIARGDMAAEVGPARIPVIQKAIIKKCHQHAKPVITATQMLSSMISHPRPTRAEVSDIANAIYDGTDAVMLSGETARGKYPLEAVQLISDVAKEVESQKKRTKKEDTPFFEPLPLQGTLTLKQTQRDFLCKAAAESPYYLPLKRLVVDTRSGRSARIIAAHRSPLEVHVVSSDEALNRALSLSYGIYAHFIEANTKNDLVIQTLTMLKMKGELEDSDWILFLYGTPMREESSEILEINTVGQAIKGRL